MRVPPVLAALAVAWMCAARLAIAAPLPIVALNVSLDSTATIRTYSVDLGTLPPRGVLRIIVNPDGADATMQLQVRALNWQGTDGPGACPGPSSVFTSASGPGRVEFVVSMNGCDARAGAFIGDTVDIEVRALHFGSGSAPASVTVLIRGETRPPLGTEIAQIDTTPAPVTAVFTATRDTVLYQDDPDASNGGGAYLWAGARTLLTTSPLARRSLMVFDVSPSIPSSATIEEAELLLTPTLILGGGGNVGLVRVGSTSGSSWKEGAAVGAGNQFFGANDAAAANWLFRSGTSQPWSITGGEPSGSLLATKSVTSTSARVSLNTSALANAVAEMVEDGADANGFLIAGPAPTTLGSSRGIQFASRESLRAVDRPQLSVVYTPVPSQSGEVSTGTVNYINEGQNFRWIYDLDLDSIFVTGIGGVCDATPSSVQQLVPYSYRYEGTPGFVGIDCCTWRIEAASGVIGTGQALFFHNLDSGNPANLPPDTDRDGIKDLCDNCALVPNGPLFGACRTGPAIGAPCRSNAECGASGLCSLSQEDANGDFVGDVCVPEPESALALVAGVAGLASIARRNRGADGVRSPSCPASPIRSIPPRSGR